MTYSVELFKLKNKRESVLRGTYFLREKRGKFEINVITKTGNFNPKNLFDPGRTQLGSSRFQFEMRIFFLIRDPEKLSNHFFFIWLSYDCKLTIKWLSCDCKMTANDCNMTVKWLSHDYHNFRYNRLSVTSHPDNRLISIYVTW